MCASSSFVVRSLDNTIQQLPFGICCWVDKRAHGTALARCSLEARAKISFDHNVAVLSSHRYRSWLPVCLAAPKDPSLFYLIIFATYSADIDFLSGALLLRPFVAAKWRRTSSFSDSGNPTSRKLSISLASVCCSASRQLHHRSS